ncbi:MAG: dual specificity protein phosphatase family protein [Gammaproteobacteria bacterium]|nr:dual specificity protein phosphatase family protein [Gammaproteobacteria bacterium]
MKHIFGLRPNLIAGRSGPNLDPWKPAELAAAGIGAVLSVNDAASVYSDDLSKAGIESACFPLADNAPPRVGDFEHCLAMLPAALDYLLAVMTKGKTPLVHCTAGKDRTGLTMCHYLCQCEGFHPRAAIDEVRRVRPIALSASGYETFAFEVLNALNGS